MPEADVTFHLIEGDPPPRRRGRRSNPLVDGVLQLATNNPGQWVQIPDSKPGLISTLRKRPNLSVRSSSTGTEGLVNVFVRYDANA